MPLTTPQTVGLLAASVLAVGAGGLYMMKSNQVAAAYLEAAADCEAGRGDARLRALDKLYGSDAQPDALRLDLSTCALKASADRYIETKRALNALTP